MFWSKFVSHDRSMTVQINYYKHIKEFTRRNKTQFMADPEPLHRVRYINIYMSLVGCETPRYDLHKSKLWCVSGNPEWLSSA